MKRKVIGLIVGSVIFSIFFLVGCTKENEEYKKFITDRVHIYNHIEKEEILEDTSNTNLKKVHKNKTDFFEIEGVEVVEDTDFDSFLPSYNLFVTKALMEKDTEVDYYYTWFNIKDDRKVDFDSSCLFLNYCGYNSEILNSIIPSVYSCVELENYFKGIGSFYKGNQTAYPLIGDLVLLDDNLDNVADRVGIVTFVSDFSISVIGVNSVNNKIIEYTCDFNDNKIYGYCRPDYGYLHLENFKDSGLPLNAVDTVVKLREQKYADALAANGVEVIARYINPESRNPLTLDEVEMFSRAGVRVMMIYQVNKDDPYKGYDKGIELGTKALKYASDLGAPEGMPIFFCCDCNNRPESLNSVVEFIQGVRDSMQGKYGVGLYGGFYTCEAMYNLGLLDAYWQCWGYSDKYLSNNLDMIQYTGGIKLFEEIPYYFDANYVKYPEKVSYIINVDGVN